MVTFVVSFYAKLQNVALLFCSVSCYLIILLSTVSFFLCIFNRSRKVVKILYFVKCSPDKTHPSAL